MRRQAWHTSASAGAVRCSSGPLHLGQTRISSRSGARLIPRTPAVSGTRAGAATWAAPSRAARRTSGPRAVLLGARVFLELHAKVLTKWRRQLASLKRLGYAG